MKPNLILGAISGNYKIDDIKNWVTSAKRIANTEDRIFLLIYNVRENLDLIDYLTSNNIEIYQPDFGLMGNAIPHFETNTGAVDKDNSFRLIHNIRFLHFWHLLNNIEYNEVLITDVKDVVINKNPFNRYAGDEFIVASSEEILYRDHNWNKEHLELTFGLASIDMLDKPVYNVGVVLGKGQVLVDMCMDIYLNAVNKTKVADQTAFNYLIQHSYKSKTTFTDLQDMWAVHLHVVNEGRVAFDLNTIKEYTIIHQYDRLGDEILNYYTLPR